MKIQSLFGLSLNCAIVAAICLPILAQSQSERYPTATEMKQLSVELNREVKAILQSTSIYSVREFRTPEQRQAIKNFINAWSKVDINIAPFLGTWSHFESAIHIYPSNVKNQVCILTTGYGQGYFIGLGTVYNKQLRLSDNQIYFRQSVYLSSASIVNNSPVLGSILHNQTSLPKLRKLKGYMVEQNQEEQDLVIQEFTNQGCLDSLPNRKTTTRTSVNTGDFYFVADSAFPDTNSAAREVRKLKNTGYSGAGMFWIPDYPNLSNKPLFQVYSGKFSNRDDCANFLSSYSQSHPAAYCVFGSKDSSASSDRFHR